jgi:hypothetical protein
MKKKSDVYPLPAVGLKTLITQLAWATSCGVKIECVTPDEEILISHPKSNWDFYCEIGKPSHRLDANKVILNWVNGIFPATFDECDWP